MLRIKSSEVGANTSSNPFLWASLCSIVWPPVDEDVDRSADHNFPIDPNRLAWRVAFNASPRRDRDPHSRSAQYLHYETSQASTRRSIDSVKRAVRYT